MAELSYYGADIVAREYTHDKASDFLAILTNIKAADPDWVYPLQKVSLKHMAAQFGLNRKDTTK